MTESEKYKWIDEWSKTVMELEKIPNQTEKGIKIITSMGDLLLKVWESGRTKGYKQGRESRFDIKKN